MKMDSIILFSGIMIGFFLPGFLLNRILSRENDFGSAYIVSVVVLFHAIFWTGICGFKITLVSIGITLVFINLSLFCYCLVKGVKFKTATSFTPALTRTEKLVLIPVLLSVILIFFRSSIFNSLGDQLFRWYFLASRILETGSFSYYPPMNTDEYNVYFFIDSFPPIISFSYFWLYSLLGKTENALACIPVTLQFIFILVFGYRLSVAMFYSKRAGIISVLLLSSSTLLFYSVMLAQETGITALSLLALTYFLVRKSPCPNGDILLAAFAASLGALSREYGGIFIICGIVVILWQNIPMKQLIGYLIFCTVLTAPWYIRTFILTGNPFYSNPVGGVFPVNEVHAGILEGYREAIGLRTYMTTKVILPLASGLSIALGISFFTGVLSCAVRFRRLGFSLIITILMLMLWAYSMQIVPGGIFHSMRILSPIIALNAVCGAFILLLVTGLHKRAYHATLIILSVLCLATFIQNIFVPCNPLKLKTKDDFLVAACIVPDPAVDPDEIFNLLKEIPDNSIILSDGPRYHAPLVMDMKRSRNIRLIPVWSSEVKFLFDNATSFEQCCQKLEKMEIRYVLMGRNGNLNMNYYRKFEFFRKYPTYSKPLDDENRLFMLPDAIPASARL